ncbi:MAG: c-type cytochrome [Gammaproteobacteria bacterium]|nr:c-type cytochrome [Gammaproteobacteria bacterium]
MKISQTIWLSPFLIAATLTLASCGGGSGGGSDDDNSGSPSMSSVGKKIYFDEDLSSNGNQSCGSCHDPAAGFSDPNVTAAAPVSEGSVPGRFGNRNAPTAAYAASIPSFVKVTTTTADGTASNYQGGQFLDGRRDTLADQAKDPFLNPVEMNNVDKTAVVTLVQNATYADEFKDVFGANVFADIDLAYDDIADAIAAFETSNEVNPFTSKFDAVMAGNASFTDPEQRGFDLFTGVAARDAKCANCHTVNSPDASGSLFTDFNYFNIGTPANPANPIYTGSPGFIDQGLADNAGVPALEKAAEQGKFRTPTLRNIESTAPYMHNGVFATLDDVIQHYDIDVANGFSTPEVNANIANELDPGGLTGLGLQPQDYTDLEAFMLTLTDGFF